MKCPNCGETYIRRQGGEEKDAGREQKSIRRGKRTAPQAVGATSGAVKRL